MMYNEIVEDCFFQPRHTGVIDLDDPLTVRYSCNQKNQRIIKIDFYLQCTNKAVIKKACFRAKGNPYVIAALEWSCRQSEGKEFEKLIPINYQTLIQVLGIPNNEYPTALLVANIYKEVLILMKKNLEDYKS